MDKVSKNDLEVWQSISVPKSFLPGSYKFQKVFFSIIALADVNEGGTPYMGISPGRTRPCMHGPEQEQERAHQRASSGSAAQDSLGKNVSKEVCFWLQGKDNLVQLPKRTQHYVNSGCSLFFGAAMEFHKCVCWRKFYKQGPVWLGFAHCLILKDGAVPAIKDPGHDSELQRSETVSWEIESPSKSGPLRTQGGSCFKCLIKSYVVWQVACTMPYPLYNYIREGT